MTMLRRFKPRFQTIIKCFSTRFKKRFTPQPLTVRLHRVIERESSFPYLPAPEFDFLEYGASDGRLLYPDTKVGKRKRIYNSLDDEEGHIQLRNIPKQSDLGLQYVVQVTEAGEWGFVTGGYLLQTLAGDDPNEHSIR